MNKKMIESFIWLLIPAICVELTHFLTKMTENGGSASIADLKVLGIAVLLAAVRVFQNYRNPNDTRYGKTENTGN